MKPLLFLIEDDDMLRENITSFLERYGYNVKSFGEGKSALEEFTEKEPDLIICDIMLPGMDGYEILEEIKSLPLSSQTPFIFLTAKSTMGDLRKGMNLGVDDYITKPFKYDDLLIALEIRLKKKENLGKTVSIKENPKTKIGLKQRVLWIETEDAIENYPVEQIIYIHKINNGSVCYLDTAGEKVALYQDFDELFKQLVSFDFKKISDRYAVNIHKIQSVKFTGNLSGEVMLRGVKKALPITPGYIDDFKEHRS